MHGCYGIERRSVLVGVLLLAFPLSAICQQQQLQQQQFQQELIRQGYQHQQDMASEPAKVNYGVWGALALGMSGDTNSFGTASGRSTRQEAEHAAMESCAQGADNCEILEAYVNSCIAVAEVKDAPPDDLGGFSFSVQASSRRSKNEAIKHCQSSNRGRVCHSIYSDCSFPGAPMK